MESKRLPVVAAEEALPPSEAACFVVSGEGAQGSFACLWAGLLTSGGCSVGSILPFWAVRWGEVCLWCLQSPVTFIELMMS